jgi:site-specific recombinase XerC
MLRDRVKAFLAFLRHNRNVSPHTSRAYASDLDQFLDHVARRDRRKPSGSLSRRSTRTRCAGFWRSPTTGQRTLQPAGGSRAEDVRQYLIRETLIDAIRPRSSARRRRNRRCRRISGPTT